MAYLLQDVHNVLIYLLFTIFIVFEQASFVHYLDGNLNNIMGTVEKLLSGLGTKQHTYRVVCVVEPMPPR